MERCSTSGASTDGATTQRPKSEVHTPPKRSQAAKTATSRQLKAANDLSAISKTLETIGYDLASDTDNTIIVTLMLYAADIEKISSRLHDASPNT